MVERQDKLEQLGESFIFLAEALDHQVWLARPDGALDYVNQRVLDYFGRTFDEMIGWGWQNVLHPEDVDPCFMRWKHSLETGQNYEFEFRLLRYIDKSYRWHLARATPLLDANGKTILKWFGACTDIHERKVAEAALRESEAQSRLIAKACSDGTWLWDVRADRVAWSERMLQLTGAPHAASGSSSKEMLAILHPEDRPRVDEALHQHLMHRTPFHLELRLGRGDGSYRSCAARGMAEWDAKGEPLRMAIGVSDITELKRSEAMLQDKIATIERQKDAIRQLSTPIIEVWSGVLTMPVLGAVDASRAEQMMEVLLEAVARTRCRYTIVDLTGVDTIDSATADHILRLVRAVKLLGAEGIVVGIRPEFAKTVVSFGADWSHVVTLANLREALLRCMRSSNARQRGV